MTVFDVFMVILGLVLIAVSFFFTEKVTSKGKQELAGNTMKGLDEDALLALQNTVEENLMKISEATIVKTENSLNKITNEKIMAISDYSDQILAKIDQNHTEVVFLYNMLNDKESSLKASLVKENSIKENPIAEEHNNQETFMEKVDSKGSEADNQTDSKDSTNYTYREQQFTEEDKQNNNQEIMKLYASGKSITEIAKTLDLGKGEVSFVVNLYKQR
ncbi:DUF6115 domain-containing protein [Anaerosporobacter sp.]